MTALEASAVLVGPTAPEPVLTRVLLPPASAHQVVVEVHASGICHSQLNQIAEAPTWDIDRPQRLLGHEAVGTVLATGSSVDSVYIGQSVLVGWLPRHGVLGGRTPSTPKVRAVDLGGVATTPDVFTWSSHTLVDEAFLYPVPEPDPLYSIIGCAVMTGAGAVVRTAATRPGDTVAVIGIGGVGGAAIAAARAADAAEVIAIDIDDGKLGFARELGAHGTINVRDHDDVPGAVAEMIPAGVDHVIDCVVSSSSIADAIAMARRGRPALDRGGDVVIVGVPRGPITADLRYVQANEIRLVGSFGGSTIPDEDFARYLSWSATGRLPLRTLVSRTYPLTALDTAVDDLAHGRILGRAIFIC